MILTSFFRNILIQKVFELNPDINTALNTKASQNSNAEVYSFSEKFGTSHAFNKVVYGEVEENFHNFFDLLLCVSDY